MNEKKTIPAGETGLLDGTQKGMPGGVVPFPIDEIGAKGWNVLAEDLPLPLAILKQSAMDHNSAWMQRFLALSGAVLAPHGKTPMSPELFHRQLRDGAWAITLGNISQVQVARQFGIDRIVLANQLVGRQAIGYIMDELRREADFDFYCLIDSVENARTLATAARQAGLDRPLKLLLEGGVRGRRTGCRTRDEAMAVAREVKSHASHLALVGVEGFEGVISGPTQAQTEAEITAFIEFLGAIAGACIEEDLFTEGPVILSAGGSAYYDIVTRVFSGMNLARETLVVVRSGCYLTHDSILYRKFVESLIERSAEARDIGEPPRAAMEVWAYVQSRPEPGRIILTMGKRDASYDSGLAKALSWFRPGEHKAPQAIGEGYMSVEVNDQHLFMDVPADAPLQVGDMVAFGISHPCLTFDKWRVIPVVDDAYNVVSAIRTYF